MTKVIQLGEHWKRIHIAELKRIYVVMFQISQFTTVNPIHIYHLLRNGYFQAKISHPNIGKNTWRLLSVV